MEFSIAFKQILNNKQIALLVTKLIDTASLLGRSVVTTETGYTITYNRTDIEIIELILTIRKQLCKPSKQFDTTKLIGTLSNLLDHNNDDKLVSNILDLVKSHIENKDIALCVSILLSILILTIRDMGDDQINMYTVGSQMLKSASVVIKSIGDMK